MGPDLSQVEDLHGPNGIPLRHDRTCRRIADACDVEVLAVDYRRAPEHPHPAAIDDVAALPGLRIPICPNTDLTLAHLTLAQPSVLDRGTGHAHRLAQTGAHVTHRQEPGLEHGFIQGMDLVSPEAATAQKRLFDDITALIHT